MIYLDPSCLVKVLRPEVESAAVIDAISRESSIIVSILAELETLVQLKAFHLAGDYTRPRWRQLETQLAALLRQPPYEPRTLSGTLFRTALRQHRNSGPVHCRSLDRLHLAAMEELGLTRLMTHDERQARAALTLDFQVVQPGRS